VLNSTHPAGPYRILFALGIIVSWLGLLALTGCLIARSHGASAGSRTPGDGGSKVLLAFTDDEFRTAFAAGVQAGRAHGRRREPPQQKATFRCAARPFRYCVAHVDVRLLLPLEDSFRRGYSMGLAGRDYAPDVQTVQNSALADWRAHPGIRFEFELHTPARSPPDAQDAADFGDDEFWNILEISAAVYDRGPPQRGTKVVGSAIPTVIFSTSAIDPSTKRVQLTLAHDSNTAVGAAAVGRQERMVTFAVSP
jgi:ribosome modulation factor